jgi:hypothetical protein
MHCLDDVGSYRASCDPVSASPSIIITEAAEKARFRIVFGAAGRLHFGNIPVELRP